ncbi:MAG: bifunctional diaminohydroxyphosphoribosylaminopyrimidine deaminase/5-amino-6-(5-phosphoribosylamino)uracil reductase RibD [Candidatus Cloacimonetes bacterium]|nr:bifunctional diaminohydroxyphosphoribosylaminopyrimidine deaminase/5-amino-6-(5-phosphoribosylamino)uracil reductase RibD [Candidatus Cloacimonadota bacterium]
MSFKESFFQQAYELAEQGRGKCGINPFVGALLVKDNRIIGSGFTQKCGKNHAEIEAILNARESTAGAELYVTLEPCCHQGRTPPCTDAIIKAGIKKVYAGIIDPNPLVSGKGFEKLRAAGIEVQDGFWQQKIEKQLEYYLTYRRKKRPFIFMKNAVSLDGKIATDAGDSKWISSTESREYSHLLRREAGAIITGIDTVLSDDPLLNVRLDGKSEPILRIILDSRLRIPLESKIVTTAQEIPTIVFKSEDHTDYNTEQMLTLKGVQVKSLPAVNYEYLSLPALIEELNKLELPVLMIEAGQKLCSSFLRAGLVDKIYYFISPKILGGKNSVFDELGIDTLAEAINIKIDKVETVGDDLLIIGYIMKE